MKNVLMVDIETTGTKPGCKVLSIGAFGFNTHAQQCEFYARINVIDQAEHGLKDEDGTISWWTKQPEETSLEAFSGRLTGKEALANFTRFIEDNFDISARDFQVWSCGIDFDFPILQKFFETYGFFIPWNFWQQYDYRTIKNIFKQAKDAEGNVQKHSAIEDAKAQMRGLRCFHMNYVEKY